MVYATLADRVATHTGIEEDEKMILRFQTARNTCGNAKQIEIDFIKKTYKKGYFIFSINQDITNATAAQYNQLLEWLKNNDFMEV